MNKNKDKLIISKLEEEPQENGNVLLKITLKRGERTFKFAADYDDYMDEYKRRSLNRLFVKRVKQLEKASKTTMNEVKQNIKKFENQEIDEDE